MNQGKSPQFCLTSDVDWASDYCIQDFCAIASSYGVKPTIFATHKSPVLEKLEQENSIQVGIHPNFLPGSSHGGGVQDVIEHMIGQFPRARTFRSHSFFDNSIVTAQMVKRGFLYDSNLCLHLQSNIVPLKHSSGLVRFPVFWEDDVHFSSDRDWQIENNLPDFLTPGLKILNFHPFLVAANVPNIEYYTSHKAHSTTLTESDAHKIRYDGEGVRTFLIGLLEALLGQGHRFVSLDELYNASSGRERAIEHTDSSGRQSDHADEEHRKYWAMSDAEKQQFLQQSFKQRQAKDPYATSRDYNVRELEISSLKRHIGEVGPIVDLGCGNGYTLISLAKELNSFPMVGVDFTESLIEGALAIRNESVHQLQSSPEFICADAVKFIKERQDNSVAYLITERFVQNLPNPDLQKDLLKEAYRVLVPGGRFLMCEGSEDSFRRLNSVRKAVGLAEILATSKDNISTIRIKDQEFEEFAIDQIGFRLAAKVGYSQYFVITRVLHPLMVHPRGPRFDAPINDLARNIQEQVPFEPGYGSNTLWVFEK